MNLRQKILRLLVALTLSIAAQPSGRADEPGIQRYLVGSLHPFGDMHAKQGHTNFHAAVEQGVFVYDINDGHKLVKKFPAKAWTSWSGGWAGLAAHAGSGVLFQVQDGSAIRAYDFLGEKLLWETSAQKGSQNRTPSSSSRRSSKAFCTPTGGST